MDMGTHESLLDAHHFVQTIQKRQGLEIACLEEIALRNGWIDMAQVESLASSGQGNYLRDVLRRPGGITP